MTQPIEVRVPRQRAEDNPIFANMRVINQLKEAGVPVLGATVLQGVSHGTMGIWFDSKTQEHVYSWSKDDTNVPMTAAQVSERNAFMPKSAAAGAAIKPRGLEADPLNSEDEDDEL